MHKQVCIFVGPPGAGKGSLSALCVKQLGFVQLSTGNLCRKHIAEQTVLGKEIDLVIKSGKLISDRLIVDMIVQWFVEHREQMHSVILDGFPRTVVQAQMFEEFLNEFDPSIQRTIVHLKVPDKSLIARISNRAVCQNTSCQAVYSLNTCARLAPKQEMVCDECSSPLIKRSDDEQATMCNRLVTYHKHAQELFSFYQQLNKEICEIDGEQSLNLVFDQLKCHLGSECL